MSHCLDMKITVVQFATHYKLLNICSIGSGEGSDFRTEKQATAIVCQC